MFFHLVFGHLCWIFIHDALGATPDVSTTHVPATSNEKIQYVLFTTIADWYTARLACKGLGGYLATLETAGHLDMVERFSNDVNIWGESWANRWVGLHEIGLSLVNDDDQCSDVGNDAILKSGNVIDGCYRIEKKAGKLELDRHYCENSNQFICQRYIADSVTSAIVITATDKPPPCSITVGTVNTKTQYVLFTTKMDWHTARLVCKGIKGYLATIKDRQLTAIKQWVVDPDIWNIRWDHSWTGLHRESGTTNVIVVDDYNCTSIDENTLGLTPVNSKKLCYRVEKNLIKLKEEKCGNPNRFICQRYMSEDTENFRIAIVMGKKYHEAIELEQGCPRRDISHVYTTTLVERQYVTVSAPIQFVSVTATTTVTTTRTTLVVSTHKEVISIAAPTVTLPGELLTTTVRETSCITSTNVLTTQPMSTVLVTSMATCPSVEPIHVTITASETVTLPAEVLTTTVLDTSCITSTNVLMSTVLVTTMATCPSVEPVHVTITASETVTLSAEVFTTTVLETSCITSKNVLMSTVLVTTMATCPSVEPVHVTITASETVTLSAEVLTTTVLDTSCIASTNVLTTQPMSTALVTSMATCSSVQPITYVSTVQNPCSCSSFPVTQNYIRVEKNKTTICRTYNNTVPDVTAVKEAVASIVSELTVETRNLSKTVRAKTSTADRRFSSQSIGLTSVCIVFMPFAVIVLLDITTIVREMRTSFMNIKGHGFP